ncbi:glycoside hydrolase family 25 domain-containing protein [Rathayibacter soli]|uniref:hypothetical protein n=1 Tax=Rathayibacter soli TaxID=3144168 RepID=UPI0027E4AD9A|nr:hypothetical protein [Glaciibacter superstes]
MRKIWFNASAVLAAALVLTLGTGGAAFAAKPDQTASAKHPAPATATVLGNDVSWPQCGTTLPTSHAFGIVGVNDGLANTTNPCLADQLNWAAGSAVMTGQPAVELYVNTANPGPAGSWWPTSNDYAGTTVANPYGTCGGANDVACAYIYGYAKAYDDATIRGVANPAGYLWWLDVETMNSWEPNTTANAADLEGMTAYFHSIGARVGIYSTSYQWGQIAGRVSSTSNLNGLQSWIPGAKSEKAAKANCSAVPLTTGSPVTLTQYATRAFDYDVSCI